MTEGTWIALITVGVPAIIGAIAAAYKIAVEQGRSAEYKRNATETIEQKNAEIEAIKAEHRAQTANLNAQIAECRAACAFLRRQLEGLS